MIEIPDNIAIFDKDAILALLSMQECISSLSRIFSFPSSSLLNPLRTVTRIETSNILFGAMPAAVVKLPNFPFFSTKIISVAIPTANASSSSHTSNPAITSSSSVLVGEKLHSHQGAILLFSHTNGKLLALFDATAITAIRTAAATALATSFLSLPDSSVLGIIGSGTQAYFHAIAISIVRKITTILIYSRDSHNVASCINKLREYFLRHNGNNASSNHDAVSIIPAKDVDDLVQQSHIIVTVTSSATPVLFGSKLRPGQHVNAVGACQKQARELDDEAITRNDTFLFTDVIESLNNESGDWLIPLAAGKIPHPKEKLRGDLSDLVTGKIPKGRLNDKEITIFKSLGVGLEDLAACVAIYQKSLQSFNRYSTIVPLGSKFITHHRDNNNNNNNNQRNLVFPVSFETIQEARNRISSLALVTPCLPFSGGIAVTVGVATTNIYLKLENLQPVTSYKVRGAANALLSHIERNGKPSHVVTASAGNFAQGVLYVSRKLNIPATVVVPDHAPQVKLDAMKRLDPTVNIVKVPFADWWKVLSEGKYTPANGASGQSLFLSPVTNKDVIAGNGTIGLEIVLQQLPEVDCIIVPYGGGALSIGIASAAKQLNPSIAVFAVEVETAAPLNASIIKGHPVEFPYEPTFIDGMGGRSIFPEMWPYAKSLLDGSLVVTVAEVAEAVRLLLKRNCVLAEGAGAAATAAALKYSSKYKWKNCVCIVSGGNIDNEKILNILSNKL